jgi:hypothetical protein
MAVASMMVAALLLANPTAAQMSIAMNALDLVDSKVEFSADYALHSGKQFYTGKVTHAPHRERWEFLNGSTPQILLLRRDLDEATMVWPERRFYMAASFSLAASLMGGLDSEILRGREAGIEMINGEVATRYHVDKGLFIGDLWRSQDGILVKARGRLSYNGQPTDGELLLTNLRRGRADPSVFLRPEGYSGLPFKLGK